MDREDCEKILSAKFPEKDLVFISFDLSPVSGNVEGFIGEYFHLNIKYKEGATEQTEQFFVKSPPVKNETQLSWSKEMNAYKKENFLYDYVLKKCRDFGYDTSFAPKSFLCKDLIVMEDLSLKGYRLHGRRSVFDLEHCKVALRSLARFHGSCYSWEKKMSEALGREFLVLEEHSGVLIESLYTPPGEGQFSNARKFLTFTVETLVKLCRLLPESEEWKDDLEGRLKDFNCGKVLWQELPCHKSLCHGDLWSNNLLFKYEGSIPVHCSLIDYQTLRYNYPCFDALLVVYQNTRKSFRKEHLQDLMRFYFQTFLDVLQENGCNARGVSWRDFWVSLKALEPLATFQAASSRSLSLLSPEVLTESVMSGAATLEGIVFENRPELAVKTFQHDENFRNSMTEDLYDIYELL